MAYDHGNLTMFDNDDDSFYGTSKISSAIVDDDSKSTTSSDSGADQHPIIGMMQSSEEVNQINSALTHCLNVRTQLRGTLLYIQRLNSKYAHTDYMAVVRNFDNYRRQQLASSVSSAVGTPYPKIRSHSRSNNEINNASNGNIDISSSSISSTPKKRTTKMCRRRRHGPKCDDNNQPENINKETFTSTPKCTKFSQLAAAFGFRGNGGDINGDDTPKRTVREMSTKSNTISVCKIKVQRAIEASITHLQVMQKCQIKRQQQQLEQSLYQSCSNLSSFGSPILSRSSSPLLSPYSTPFAARQSHHLSHLKRMQQQNSTANDTYCSGKSNNSLNISSSKLFTPPSKFNKSSSTMQFDEGKRTLERVERCYVTPLQRMHKRLIHLNASLVRSC